MFIEQFHFWKCKKKVQVRIIICVGQHTSFSFIVVEIYAFVSWSIKIEVRDYYSFMKDKLYELLIILFNQI